MTCNDSAHQKEVLALPFQLIDHRVYSDLTPSYYTNSDGLVGAQSVSIKGKSFPLEHDSRKMF